MKLGCAVRAKPGPVMPGAAACAVAVSSKVTPTIKIGSSLVIEIALFLFIALIAALLIDMDLGHQPTEVLGIVRQVIKIGGVEIEDAARGVLGGIGRIQDHVDRLATGQRDRVGVVVEVISGLI